MQQLLTRVLPIHLRHCCPCAQCTDPVSKAKLFDLLAVAEDIAIVRERREGNVVLVDWSDGHHSRYDLSDAPLSALLDDRFGVLSKRPDRHHRACPWSESYTFRHFDYRGAIADGSPLLAEALSALLRDGIVIFDGVPDLPDLPDTFSNFFADGVQPSIFGRIQEVRLNEAGSHNLTFSFVDLPLHTDVAYFVDPVNYQALFSIDDADGAAVSPFADGLAASMTVERERPDLYRYLTGTPIRWVHCSDEVPLEAHRPVLETSSRGELRMTFNQGALHVPTSAEDLDRVYEALYAYARALERHKLETILRSGQLALFDNRRILHGRRIVKPENAGRRRLKAWYLSDDGIRVTYNKVLSR
ncbi:MAG: TauD/TfdA family dioxygenase [Thermoanaerobaculia bacterium]